MVRFTIYLWVGILLCGFVAFAVDDAASQKLVLYVGNSLGDDVSVIDMVSLKVIGDIKTGDHIHGVCVTPDATKLLVTVESDHSLRIVDTATQATLGTVSLSGRPNQCAISGDGKYVAVPIRDKDNVEIIDIAKQKSVKSLPIKEPHNALNLGSSRYIFVSSMGSHEVDVIDLEKMEFSAHIPVEGRPRPYVVSSDGKTMFVAVANQHGFNVIDVPTQKLLSRVVIPSENSTLRPLQYETPDTLTHGLALTPDGSELWVSSLLDDRMYIYDLKAKKVTGWVPTGSGPNWIVFTPDGKYACISNTDTDDISIIDVKTRHEVKRVKVGKVPKRIAVAVAPVAVAPKEAKAH
jgi:YVTN family beta-propeller protein